jgi:hypothetical protein
MASELTVLRAPLSEADWRSLGLSTLRLGQVTLQTGAPGWGFSSLQAGVLPVPTWVAEPPPGPPPVHPLGATKIDHVVLMVPWLANAEQSILETLGLSPRKRGVVKGAPMAFYRAGEAVIEVVESGLEPHLWGVTLRVENADAAVSAAQGLLGPAKPAVQGGRIATATRSWDNFTVAVLEKGQ